MQKHKSDGKSKLAFLSADMMSNRFTKLS